MLNEILKGYFIIFNRRYSKKKAIKVMEAKWDFLIILDACRYDMFTWFIGKKVPFAISGGSNTQEWLEWNFKGIYKDVVYISGNPRFSSYHLIKNFGMNPFFKTIDVWDFGWDYKYGSIPPKEMAMAIMNALKKYPNKRMIIHFIQPHPPYGGDREFMEIDKALLNNLNVSRPEIGSRHVWRAIRKGELSLKRVWIAYIRNLKVAMKEIYKIVQEIEGRVIISSDHGTLLGEYMKYGHIPALRAKHLVKVPWYTIKKGEKKQYVEEYYELKDLGKQGIIETELIKKKIKNLQKENKL